MTFSLASKTTLNLSGLNKIKRRLNTLDGKKVQTGFFKPIPYVNDEGELTGATVIDVAAAHEFGIGVPERPFLSHTFFIKKHYKEVTRQMLKRIVLLDRNTAPQLKLLGETIEKDMKDVVTAWLNPPNSPETVERKGRNDPLVDTGLMRDSIESRVTR